MHVARSHATVPGHVTMSCLYQAAAVASKCGAELLSLYEKQIFSGCFVTRGLVIPLKNGSVSGQLSQSQSVK